MSCSALSVLTDSLIRKGSGLSRKDTARNLKNSLVHYVCAKYYERGTHKIVMYKERVDITSEKTRGVVDKYLNLCS